MANAMTGSVAQSYNQGIVVVFFQIRRQKTFVRTQPIHT